MAQPQKPLAAEQQIPALGRILQSLREEDSVDVLIETTISYIHKQFNYSLIWIAFYDRLKHSLSGKGGVAPDNDLSFLRKRFVLHPGSLLEQVVIEQRPLGVADLRTENRAAEWQEFGKKRNIQGTIILPIRYKDRCFGLLLLGSERWGYLLPTEVKSCLMMVLGELGALLYQHEMDLQQKQTKRPDEPLLQLLENLRTLNKLEERLKAAIEATHEFVSPHRTSVYWFERQGRYFWCRMSNQLMNIGRDSQQQAAGMTVQELSEFYYALSMNQIVWIGEARSSLNSHFTAKLLERLKVRSLLAAPIFWQKDLLGFLAVEGNEPRIWLEADKNFVQGAAGLISLVTPTEKIESTVKQIQEDSQLTSQVAQAVYSEQDIQEALNDCATKVLLRLASTRFILLQYDPDQNNYQIVYQNQPHKRRPLNFAFHALKDMDKQMLKSAKASVEIENLDEDLRFFNWRPLLLENGVRSLLVCNCAQGHSPETLLLITHTTHRSWTALEKELLWIVSQQIGVIVRQWQLHNNYEQQQKILYSFQQCLYILKKDHQQNIEVGKNYLERTALAQIASVLDCPLVLLLSWSFSQPWVEIIPGFIAEAEFGIIKDAKISIQSEAIIHWALTQDEYLKVNVDDLPTDTRKWLNGSGIGQILIIALRTTTDYEPTGVVVLADRRQRQWSQQSLNATATLVDQLAWLRRQQQITQILDSTTKELSQLNWYKHRRLEEIQRTTTLLLHQINDLGIPANELTQSRYKLLLRQLDQTTASMTGLIKLEQWQLHLSWETMPIASILKRSLERIDHLLQQQKLWIGVHGLGQSPAERDSTNSSLLKGLPASAPPMAIAGDIVKLELVIHELLATACNRSQSGGRIDIWCRRLDERSLEVSITDNGTIEPQLLTELHQNTIKDVLNPSLLNQPPGLHLLICQNLMQQLGGELHFYQLPDHRVVSRLLLPLATTN